MSIEYSNTLSEVSWERASEIFSLIGWGNRKAEDIKSAFERSSYVRLPIQMVLLSDLAAPLMTESITP